MQQSMPSPPPPPAPVPPTHPASHDVHDGFAQSAHFTIKREEETVIFEFPDIAKPISTPTSSTIPIKTVVRSFLAVGSPMRFYPLPSLVNIVGRLRGLLFLIDQYNQVVSSTDSTDPFSLYVRHRSLDYLTVFGIQVVSPCAPILVPGLDDLLAALEDIHKQTWPLIRQTLKEGMVVFEHLGELFRPGQLVSGATTLGAERAGFLVLESYYEDKRTLFGKEQVFHLVLEFFMAMGDHIVPVRIEEVFSGWTGVRARLVSDLPYFPCEDAATRFRFEERGRQCALYGTKASFLQCSAGSFFLHGAGAGKGMSSSKIQQASRIMIDTLRGSSLSHYPSQGGDESTYAIMKQAQRYKRFHASSAGQSSEALFVLDTLPPELYAFAWPALVGYNFTIKAWGHVLVSGLSAITFNEKAFDQLVLPEARKRLVRALTTFNDKKFEDIIEGKSGGSVFLLHGPPGVGKTLTAEAISELLHRPLYYVTMGELGTTPEEMEKRLEDVLSLCTEWSALVLLDEADSFLEKRTAHGDMVRNAMVCVMLRLIEYHRGILFLTTNRVRNFDPAVESRITVALRYDPLDHAARKRVWQMLVGNIEDGAVDREALDWDELAGHEMNGRQIKNAVRLGMALANYEGVKMDQKHLVETIAVTALGRQDIAEVADY